jgi:hypothetical protein
LLARTVYRGRAAGSEKSRKFGRAAKTAIDAGLDPARFKKTSTYWMRHTFVRHALVDGVPIEVVSELARKIKAVAGMRRWSASLVLT